MENPFYSSSDFTWREHKYKACTESHDRFLFLKKNIVKTFWFLDMVQEIAKIFGFWQYDSQNISFFLVTLPRQCASTLLSKLSITNMTLKLFLSFMETCNMFFQNTLLSKFSITNVTLDFFFPSWLLQCVFSKFLFLQS